MLPDPNVPILAIIQTALVELLLRGDSIFLPFAHTMFMSIATILVVARGARIMFSPDLDGEVYRLLWLLVGLAATFAAITYYQAPMPGFGISFSNLITDQAAVWTRQLEARSTMLIYQHFDRLWASFAWPNITNLLAVGMYVVLMVALWCVKGLTIAIVAGSLTFSALSALLGPIFIPFVLVPRLESFFWTWLRVFLGTTMCQVVAAAYIFIGERLIAGVTSDWPAAIPAGWFMTYASYVFVLLAVYVPGLFFIPIYTAQLFGGHMHGVSMASLAVAVRSLRLGR